ncbi:MAG: DNA polymerase I [Zoogloeaceae bacterium]|jgi:DNA polymerase-1|nr:DNA polymerase I [Zoogloeaceae bacterium]
MPLLLLVDGSSYLYRAYHALPDLATSGGLPSGAIKGVLAMLRRLSADFKAERKAVVFDARGKTFRNEWFPEYKAHRPPMPDDLACQIPHIHDAARALGWPLIIAPGVEADDVIGTLARQAEAIGMETLVSTGDKDLAQIVTAKTRLINTMTGELLDEDGVQNKFGVPPSAIADYLALMGDSSDNIPGVPKCGPKTAAKWLQTYGTLEAVMRAAEKIPGVVGENLRAHLGFLPLGQKLATIVCDVPDLPPPDSLLPRPPDKPALESIYRQYEFRGWLTELLNDREREAREYGAARSAESSLSLFGAAKDTPQILPEAYGVVTTKADLDVWRARLQEAPVAALTLEADSADAFCARLIGLSFAVAHGAACYIPLAHTQLGSAQLPPEIALERLKPWLESEKASKIVARGKYDQHVLANHGVALAGIAEDISLLSYVLEAEQKHHLDALASRHLGLFRISRDALCGKGAKTVPFSDVEIERAAPYAAEGADFTLRVAKALLPKIAADTALSRVYREIELPVRTTLFQMERAGVLLDSDLLAAQSRELGEKIRALESEAYALAGETFNLSSPKQLAAILFEKQGLPTGKKTSGGAYSTDEDVLSDLALDYPLPKRILAWRELSKLKSTYADKLPRMARPDTGRIHTCYSQTTAITGRLASSDPNLQNIPARSEEGRKIRAAFIAPPGHTLLSADYSQIELRIMAHLSEDERLLAAFADGADVHRATAAEIFGIPAAKISDAERRVAKTINFGLIYGMSAFGLARNLHMARADAARYIERYFSRYPGVARHMEKTRDEARREGCVRTLFGRRLALPDIASPQHSRRQAAERAAINAPMQGSAADLVKLAMLAVADWLKQEKLRSRLILQVHDELILEVPEAEREIVRARLPELMQNVATLKVPLIADVGEGPHWDAAH